jgi:cytochrome c oxidase assembly protein subunit 15
MVRADPCKQPLMPETAKASKIHLRAVRLWLLVAAAMIFLTLVVGGATRLTESGLSIVEWKPVTGVLPPLSEKDWQAEFAKYQTIPQYRELNRGMSLDAFKLIYWWEWSHRLLARVTGIVFLLPFLFFLWRGVIPSNLRARLWAIFCAGAALGAVGWWMVSSGLTQGVSVSQYRLAFHLTLASAIYAAILWTAQQLAAQAPNEMPARIRVGALAIALLLLLQIYLGALVAGLDAGLAYNTWPTIDGAIVPSPERLWFLQPAWRNLFENVLTVQFNHRMLAYTIWILAILHMCDAWRTRHAIYGAVVLAGVVTVQAGLGVVTLLHDVPILLALAHQVLAIVVLTIAVVHAERLSHRTIFYAPQTGPAEQGV